MKIGNRIISRITTLALAAGIAAALLCSCGGSGDGDETTAPDSETTPEVTTEQTTAKPETTKPETTEVTEPEPEPEHPTDDTTDEILRRLLSRSVPQASTEANYSEDGDLPIIPPSSSVRRSLTISSPPSQMQAMPFFLQTNTAPRIVPQCS